MTATMQRWSMDALGRESLRLVQEPVPQPGSGEVRVRVNAVALNYRDKMVIEGTMPIPLSFPFTPASDMAGVVDSIGEGVTRFKPGARVISTFFPEWIDGKPQADARDLPYKTSGGYFQGMLAEYVIVSENALVASPESLDDAEASTLPCAGLTAWFALVERGHLRAGQSVLVQGTGGVALFALQIAKAHGAEVFVSSGSDGIDHIIETVGGENLRHSLRAVAVHGRISVIDVLAGTEISLPASELLLKSPVIQGIGVGHRRALEDFVRAVDVTELKPVIEHRYHFDELEQALEHLDRGAFGKIVLTRE